MARCLPYLGLAQILPSELACAPLCRQPPVRPSRVGPDSGFSVRLEVLSGSPEAAQGTVVSGSGEARPPASLPRALRREEVGLLQP